MKQIIIIISIFFFITSCKSDDDLGTEEFFQFETGKQLTIKTDETFEDLMEVNVCEGDKTVFKYTFRDLGEEGLADSGSSEFIYFEIDSNLDSFEFNDEELIDIQAIYKLSCFCDFEAISPFLIEIGTISGIKQDNGSWDISINIVDKGSDTIVVNEVFSMGEPFSFCYGEEGY